MEGAGATNNQVGYEELDVRGVEPPAHILRILKRVSELPGGTALRARLDNNPYQLYDLLQQRGFIITAERDPDGSYLAIVRGSARENSH